MNSTAYDGEPTRHARWLQRGVIALVGIAVLGLQSLLHADAAEEDIAEQTAVARLTALLADVSTFQADVHQMIVESTGGVLEESEIRFMLKRPNGFYWETIEPFPELIVTNGQLLWNYQPDLLQVTIEKWEAERSELAARLLNGEMDQVAAEYTVTAQMAESGEGWEFFLVPLDAGSPYERVTLYFAMGEMESMHILSGNGQRTLWQFYNRVINEPVADEVFVFVVPEDIEVVDNSQ